MDGKVKTYNAGTQIIVLNVSLREAHSSRPVSMLLWFMDSPPANSLSLRYLFQPDGFGGKSCTLTVE